MLTSIMTDVFNIDFEVDGFRKNNLDWRKFRDSYQQVSATKLERGIKPLPLPFLLKLFGPQKVFNTFVLTRKITDEADAATNAKRHSFNEKEMQAALDKNVPVTKTLSLPGNGLLLSHDEVDGTKTKRMGIKVIQRDALPVRRALQRNNQVTGRYFPKPSPSLNDHQGAVMTDTMRERPRTSFKSFQGQLRPILSSKVNSDKCKKQLKRMRGSACKVTDMVANQDRYSSRSGQSSSPTIKSVPLKNSNGFTMCRGNGSEDEGDARLQIKEAANDAIYDCSVIARVYDVRSEHQNEVKGLRQNIRQVSFPKTNSDFCTILQGKPKALHRRDLVDSVESHVQFQYQRARTHVGFIDNSF